MIFRALAASLVLAPLIAFGAIKSDEIPDLRPPREELPAPILDKESSAWIFASIGLLLILTAVLWPKRKAVVVEVPDPYGVARSKLAALRANPANATAVNVSAVIRRYAVDAFELSAPALTSEEIVSGLALQQTCPSELANAAWQFLSDCDLVKFAPGMRSPELSKLLDRAEKLLADMEAARVEAARLL